MSADKATILFGSYQVGVRLTKVMDEKDGTTPLKTTHAKCSTPIVQKRWCPACEVEVDLSETAKAFVQSKNQLIPLGNDEVKLTKDPRSSVVELTKFVDPLDDHWIERSYWLEPSLLSEKPYALLFSALGETGKWGLGAGAIWGKQRPYAIVVPAMGMSLVLHVLHTAQEFVPSQAPAADLPPLEMIESETAVMMIEAWSGQIEEEDLTVSGDTLLRQLIASKISGQDFVAPEQFVEPTPVMDVMEAMRLTIALKSGKKRSPRRKAAA